MNIKHLSEELAYYIVSLDSSIVGDPYKLQQAIQEKLNELLNQSTK